MATRARPFLLMLAIVTLALPAVAQEGGEAEAQAWMSYMTPGDHHKHMSAMEGTWTYSAKMWMDPAGGEPMISNGVSKKTMILGGRYLQEEMSGEMPMGLFSGMSLTGFDNHKESYEAIWVDNMGTGIMTFEGKASQNGKVVTTWGEERFNPASGMNEQVRTVTKIVSADEHLFEYYVTWPDQEERKVMEITYLRKGTS